MKVINTERYTVRTSHHSPSEVKQDAWDAVIAAIEKAYASLPIPGHLFFTAVGADCFRMGDGPNDWGIAIYHEGIEHIAIAAGDQPTKEDGSLVSRDEQLQEIQLSVVHEIWHYIQDINGTLEHSMKAEAEAEAIAYKTLGLTPSS